MGMFSLQRGTADGDNRVAGCGLFRRRIRFVVAWWRSEPALGVDGRHAARAGGGDGLAVDVVLDVAAGEDAFDVGGRAEPR